MVPDHDTVEPGDLGEASELDQARARRPVARCVRLESQRQSEAGSAIGCHASAPFMAHPSGLYNRAEVVLLLYFVRLREFTCMAAHRARLTLSLPVCGPAAADGPRPIVKLARQAEDLGVDAVAVADHVAIGPDTRPATHSVTSRFRRTRPSSNP
jgi:hypothetical protein